MASLQEKYAELKETEIQTKLAAIDDAWGESPEVLNLLAEAWEIVKEADDKGEFENPVDDSQALNLAVQMVADLLEEAEQETAETEEEVEAQEETETTSEKAEATDEEEVAEEAVEKSAEYQLFVEAGRVLGELGITQDEIEKIATDQEREDFAALVAQIVSELQGDEE